MEGLDRSGSVQTLFRDRMRREGRIDEYNARIEELAVARGNKFGERQRASWEVMREMGYQGPKEERRLADRHNQEQGAIVEEMHMFESLNNLHESITLKMPHLPASAPPAKEMDWVGGHPALNRLDFQRDKTKNIVITIDDVMNAPHGPAPSRRAVNMLINWANRPNEFHKQLLAEHKKAAAAAEDPAVEEQRRDITLKEVRDILEQILVPKKK